MLLEFPVHCGVINRNRSLRCEHLYEFEPLLIRFEFRALEKLDYALNFVLSDQWSADI